MSFIKRISTSLLAVGISSVSVYAQAAAADLTLINNTDSDSTSIINNSGFCSSWLKGGVTKAHSTNKVDKATIDFACALTAPACTADVYMDDNCSGPVIATIYFNTNTGFIKRDMKTTDYDVKGSGFVIQMDKVSSK